MVTAAEPLGKAPGPRCILLGHSLNAWPLPPQAKHFTENKKRQARTLC